MSSLHLRNQDFCVFKQLLRDVQIFFYFHRFILFGWLNVWFVFPFSPRHPHSVGWPSCILLSCHFPTQSGVRCMFILLYFSPVVLVSWPLAHSGQSVRLLLGSAPIFLLVSRLALIFQQLLLRQSVFIAAWFHSLRGTTTLHLRLCIFSYSSSFVLPSAVLISWSFALSGQSVRLLLGSRVTLFPLI